MNSSRIEAGRYRRRSASRLRAANCGGSATLLFSLWRARIVASLPGGKSSGHREESQDLAHDAIALVGLEKKLSVRGTIQND